MFPIILRIICLFLVSQRKYDCETTPTCSNCAEKIREILRDSSVHHHCICDLPHAQAYYQVVWSDLPFKRDLRAFCTLSKYRKVSYSCLSLLFCVHPTTVSNCHQLCQFRFVLLCWETVSNQAPKYVETMLFVYLLIMTFNYLITHICLFLDNKPVFYQKNALL